MTRLTLTVNVKHVKFLSEDLCRRDDCETVEAIAIDWRTRASVLSVVL